MYIINTLVWKKTFCSRKYSHKDTFSSLEVYFVARGRNRVDSYVDRDLNPWSLAQILSWVKEIGWESGKFKFRWFALFKPDYRDTKLAIFLPSICKGFLEITIGRNQILFSCKNVHHQPHVLNSHNWASSHPEPCPVHLERSQPESDIANENLITRAGMLAVLFKFTRCKYHITKLKKRAFGVLFFCLISWIPKDSERQCRWA